MSEEEDIPDEELSSEEKDEEEEEEIVKEPAEGEEEEVEEETQGIETASVPHSLSIVITLPLGTMNAVEQRLYIDKVIRKTGIVEEITIEKIRVLPCSDYETKYRQFSLYLTFIASSPADSSLRLISFIESFSKASSYGLHNQFRMQIPSFRSTFSDIRPDDNEIGVLSLSMGNCPNFGTFFARGTYFSSFNNNASNTKWERGDRPAGRQPLLSWIHFEHDLKQMSIRFAMPLPTGEEEDGLAYCGYRMLVQYSSIHHIVVDMKEEKNNSKGHMDKVDVYFKLNHPPLLYKKRPTMVNERRIMNLEYEKGQNNWTRVVQWPGCKKSEAGEDRIRFEGCSREALSNSPFLHVALRRRDKWKSRNTILNAMSRIQTRCPNIKIFFSSVFSIYRRMPSLRDLPSLGSFRADYALKAIMSRGSTVMDELFDASESEEQHMRGGFLMRRLEWCMEECSAACEDALELVLSALDERRNITVEEAFDVLYRTRLALYRRCESTQTPVEAINNVPDNCVVVRKIVVTPSRILPMSPDVMMTNRVVRHFGADYALRVVYRDENDSKLRVHDFGSDQMSPLLISMIKDTMVKGIFLCGRLYRFLAWSNSQMRDHGCYMYTECVMEDGSIATVDSIREWMGDFSTSKTVPKLMSRMGQCLTQAQPTVLLYPNEWALEKDIEGGEGHPETQDKYVFSDGVGRLSLGLARSLAQILQLKIVPSCFQVRFKGFKGVLTIDRTLDVEGKPKVVFRKSQMKFLDAKIEEADVLEVVKYAMPSPMCLNRPLITILDYIAEKHGRFIHERMSARLTYYLELELNTISQMLIDEEEASVVLCCRLPLPIDFPRLSRSGFSLTNEPFFRQMLVSIYRHSITNHLLKAKLELPPAMGRSMYGVLDETGLLQYGQVFIQYSPGIRNASNTPLVHLGPVLVSKNPCHVAGDTRMFTAVWQPSLSHLSDVIVFPRYGPRPHADEMAGSDLDGDEYSVIFDPLLFFDNNEPPMIFPKTLAKDFEFMPTTEDMADFFLKYIQYDCVGRVSNAHLYSADFFGLFSKSCEELARKCSIAVDFPKTGEPAGALERSQIMHAFPDFAESKSKVTYRSQRLNGRMYRRVKKIEDVLELCERTTSLFEGYKDTLLYDEECIVGRRVEWQETRKLKKEYAAEIEQIMHEYSIGTEGEVVSGKLVKPKRLAAMEKDDYSFYNTDKVVELRYQKMWSKYRRIFFEEFGGEEELTETDEEGHEVVISNAVMREKARLWYMAAYEGTVNEEGEEVVPIGRSFAWIVWDVLADLKRIQIRSIPQSNLHVNSPISRKLTEEMREWLNGKGIEYDEAKKEMEREDKAVERYARVYGEELYHVVFVLRTWIHKHALHLRSPLRSVHLSRLLIQFALGNLHIGSGMTLPLKTHVFFPYKLDYSSTPVSQGDITISEPGYLLLNFLSYIGSDAFHSVSSVGLSLDDPSLDPSPFLSRSSFWRPLSQLAYKTIHEIAVSGRFSSLGIGDDAGMLSHIAESVDPLIISAKVFSGQDNYVIISTLKKWTGVELIAQRQCQNRRDYLLTVVGTAAARSRLSRLVQMDADQLINAIRSEVKPRCVYDESF